MKKNKHNWMLAAILMICGLWTLASCSDDEHSNIAVAEQVTGKTYFVAYEATGENQYHNGNVLSYNRVLEYYRFTSPTEGTWGRFYFDDDDVEPVDSDGDMEGGDFNYTSNDAGKITINFENNPFRDGDDTPEKFKPQTVTIADGILTGTGVDGNSYTFEKTDETMNKCIEEYSFAIHGGADDLITGNRIYGVGYGYNFILDHSVAVSRAPIVDPEYVSKNNLRETNGTDAGVYATTYTGHTLSEIANDFAGSVVASGGICGFKGEVGASFSSEYRQNSEAEYALTVVNAVETTVTLAMGMGDIMNHLNPKFKAAVEGKESWYKGENGILRLVKDYGTHLVTRAKIGGRLRCSNVVKLKDVKGAYDIEAFAKASYENFSFSTEGKVEDQFKKSYTENKKAVETIISCIGGSVDAVTGITRKGAGEEEYQEWLESLKEDGYKNTNVVEVVEVIPIWDLVEDKNRSQEIKKYITGGKYEHDMSGNNVFVIGAMGKIEDVSRIFTKEDDENGTLVKNLKVGDNTVALACKEFIPTINSGKSCIVLYPVVNNQPKFNLGYFVGSESQRPARVCWFPDNATPTIIEIPNEKKIGMRKEIFILGSSFLNRATDAGTINDGQFVNVVWEDAYMVAPGFNSKGVYETEHKYPLVKLFNHVWTRENLSCEINNISKKSNNAVYYHPDFLRKEEYRKSVIPVGWKLPNNVDYKSLLDEMGNRRVNMKELGKGGVTAFNIEWNGYINRDNLEEKGENAQFWATNKGNVNEDDNAKVTWTCRISKSGSLNSIFDGGNNIWHYNIRLIENLTW